MSSDDEGCTACAFCGGEFDQSVRELGPKLGPISCMGQRHFAHRVCTEWTPEVFITERGTFKNLSQAIKRGKLIRCSYCGDKGGVVGCFLPECSCTYHLQCARKAKCTFFPLRFLIACPSHIHLAFERGLRGASDNFDGSVVPGNKRLFGPPQNPSQIPQGKRQRVSRHIAKAKEALIQSIALEPNNEDEMDFCRTRDRLKINKLKVKLKPLIVGAGSTELPRGFPAEGFAAVGGMKEVINALKEMVSIPLMYPKFLEDLQITPPRGILLQGPPGCGKTHVVRCLAVECALKSSIPIALFVRKASDCLGKYYGESEKTLKVLFEEAKNHAPSIIFLDELDALLPHRRPGESAHDKVFASLVATMLALMDGLEDRGNVVVIGATNRPEGIDSALRRPGRFEREIRVGLPTMEERKEILTTQTKLWPSPPNEDLVCNLATKTEGASGADLQSLCTKAAMSAVKKHSNSVMSYIDSLIAQKSTSKSQTLCTPPLLAPPAVSQSDWEHALGGENLLSCCREFKRTLEMPKRMALGENVSNEELEPIITALKCAEKCGWKLGDGRCMGKRIEKSGKDKKSLLQSMGLIEGGKSDRSTSKSSIGPPGPSYCPLLIYGNGSIGQEAVCGALMTGFLEIPCYCLSLAGLLSRAESANPTTGCIDFMRSIQNDLKTNEPVILHIPVIESWAALDDNREDGSSLFAETWGAFLHCTDQLSAEHSTLLLATSHVPFPNLPKKLRRFFKNSHTKKGGIKNCSIHSQVVEMTVPITKRPKMSSLNVSDIECTEQNESVIQSQNPTLINSSSGAIEDEQNDDQEWDVDASEGHLHDPHNIPDFQTETVWKAMQRMGEVLCQDKRCALLKGIHNECINDDQSKSNDIMEILEKARDGQFENIQEMCDCLNSVVKQTRAITNVSDRRSVLASTLTSMLKDDIDNWVHLMTHKMNLKIQP